MTVNAKTDAWKIVDAVFPADYAKDEKSSAKAGYPVYRAARGDKDAWISDLGNRLEVNYGDGNTLNIWVIEQEKEVRRDDITSYLKLLTRDLYAAEKLSGVGSTAAAEKYGILTACLKMAEHLLGKPVRILRNGDVA